MAETTLCTVCGRLVKIVRSTRTKPHEPMALGDDGETRRAELDCGHSKLVVVPKAFVGNVVRLET
jgi:hypothetical protein